MSEYFPRLRSLLSSLERLGEQGGFIGEGEDVDDLIGASEVERGKKDTGLKRVERVLEHAVAEGGDGHGGRETERAEAVEGDEGFEDWRKGNQKQDSWRERSYPQNSGFGASRKGNDKTSSIPISLSWRTTWARFVRRISGVGEGESSSYAFFE